MSSLEHRANPASWIETIGWVSLGLAFAGVLLILFDIFGRGYRQKMWIYQEVIFPPGWSGRA